MEPSKNSASSTAEQATEFHRIADARWTELLATGKAVPFLFANLSATQLASLSPNATTQKR